MFQDVDVKIQVRTYLNFDVNCMIIEMCADVLQNVELSKLLNLFLKLEKHISIKNTEILRLINFVTVMEFQLLNQYKQNLFIHHNFIRNFISINVKS